MFRFAGLLAISVFLVACGNNQNTGKAADPDPVKPHSLEAPVYQVPQRTTGVFLGHLPCKDCRMLDRMINLQDSYYTIYEHHQGSTDRTKMGLGKNGKCTQDSGLISLFNAEQQLIQQYRIAGMDSLLLLMENGKATTGKPVYLIRKDGQKIVK